MTNIEDLINFENEHAGLDFKLLPYRSNANEDLLKDILAMANAAIEGDRRIIIGLKPTLNDRNIVGISDALVDEASYQQLVLANIEPELHIVYYPFEYDGKTLAVLQIKDPTSQPYMLKKAFGSLKQGLILIRKGSTQLVASRADLDRMYEKRPGKTQFHGKLSITPVLPNARTKDKLIRVSDKEFSLYAQKLILQGQNFSPDHIDAMQKLYGGRNRMDAIEKIDNNVDLYFLWEEYAAKVNFLITNTADEYLEDVTVELRLPKMTGLMVKSTVTLKDHHRFIGSSSPMVNPNPTLVKHSNNEMIFQRSIGNVKHGLSLTCFDPDLRMIINDEYSSTSLPGTFLIYAKNLQNTITLPFIIEVE